MIYNTLNVVVDGHAFKNLTTAEVHKYNYTGVLVVLVHSPCNTGSLCTYAATWRVDQLTQEIEVEMTRNNRGWIALGFSDDDRMASLFP